MKTLNWKISVLHGLIAGILAATAGIIYLVIYKEALGINYAKLINPVSIAGSCIFGCMLMAIGYALLQKFGKVKYTGILNILIALLSFASIIGPIAMTLPLDTANPELFPGLVAPMHFFPALAFFTITPFFTKPHLSNK
jgi:O-antigen/teichoic acid export membrane protein